MTILMEKQPDSRELVAAAQRGNRDSFDSLVKREGERLRRLVASRVNAHLALSVEVDDVFQETLLRAFRGIERFEWQGDDSFVRWVGGIAENVIRELARSEARERRSSLKDDVADGGVSPSRTVRRGERLERLEAAIDNLEKDHREVIRLTRMQGLSFVEAAERMGRSPDAVKQLLYRAIKQLRSSFGDTESLNLPDRPLGVDKGDDDER